MILAIDPGPTESAWVLYEENRRTCPFNEAVRYFAKQPNDEVLDMIRDGANRLVIEKIASYGMAVGAEVFETCVWTGRFIQAFGADRCDRIERLKIKLHLCHDSKAKDANIRQALIDRIGPPGTKKQPGPTYGIAGDVWSALAVAVTWADSPEYWMARTRTVEKALAAVGGHDGR